MPELIPQDRIDEVVKRIVEGYNPKKIILFGSYANGTQTVHSDLDLFIVKNTTTRPIERGVEVRVLLKEIIMPMDIVIYTPEEYEKHKNQKYGLAYEIQRTGKIIYEQP